MAQNPFGTLPPEEAYEQQQIARQQQLANLLMQQGMQSPQGQMVSGRYVPPSIFQNLAGLANIYVGQKKIEEADKRQLNLAEKLREGREIETKAIMDRLRGPEQRTEMAGPYTENIPKPVLTNYGQPDVQGALDLAMRSKYGAGQALMPTLIQRALPEPEKPTEDMKNYLFAKQQGDTRSFNEFRNQMTPYQQANLKLEREKFEFQKRQKDEEAGPMFNNNGIPVGRFDKTGRYISPQGRVYTASAVTEAQKEHDVAMDLAYKLNNITKDDIKNAYGSAFDYTTTKAGQMLGNKEVVAAQNKINDIQIKKVLDNLSQLKGASSDKEMAQMIKDFPGYTANPEVMEKWVERAAKTTNRFLQRSENRYGFDTDYAQEGRFAQKQQGKPSAKLSSQDQEALNWANANPNDPRAAAIRQRLGM
jgi:hypothetical protein